MLILCQHANISYRETKQSMADDERNIAPPARPAVPSKTLICIVKDKIDVCIKRVTRRPRWVAALWASDWAAVHSHGSKQTNKTDESPLICTSLKFSPALFVVTNPSPRNPPLAASLLSPSPFISNSYTNHRINDQTHAAAEALRLVLVQYLI